MASDPSKPSPPVARLRGFPAGHPFVCGCIQRLSRDLPMAFSGKRINKPPVTKDGQRLLQAAAELLGKISAQKNIAAAKKTNR